MDAIPDLARFFGRFHPVILHLPIGMLVLAVFLEFGSLFTRKESPALQGTLFFAAATSVVAVLLGFLLYIGDEDIRISPGAQDHLWGGIAFSCLAITTFLIKAWTDAGASAAWVYKLMLVASSGVMAYTSHDGASLVHGQDYLTEFAPEPLRGLLGGKPAKEDAKPADGSAATPEPLVYQDIVAPMLEEKCWKCHNEKKIKGKMRMDAYELLVKGGADGPGLEVGHAEKSNIIIRMELPIDNDERMPPDEKPGLKPDEIEVIKWWINTGAKADVTLATANPPANIAAIIAKIKPSATVKTTAGTTGSAAPVAPAVDTSKERTAIAAAMTDLQKSYPGAAQFDSQASNSVNFTAVSMRGSYSDDDAKKISTLAPHLGSVDFTATLISDAALSVLEPAKNLRKLNLGETKITDVGLSTIAKFDSLESLNLFGTEVTDAGIQQLGSLKNLKRLYVWRSKVTPEGIEALRKLLPSCDVVMGIQ